MDQSEIQQLAKQGASGWFSNYFTGNLDFQRALTEQNIANAFSAQEAEKNRQFNASEAERARQFNKSEAQIEREWQEHLRDTSYISSYNQAKQLGLNPYAMFSSIGASSAPSGAAASAASASGSQASGHVASGFSSGSAGAGLLRSGLGLIESAFTESVRAAESKKKSGEIGLLKQIVSLLAG